MTIIATKPININPKMPIVEKLFVKFSLLNISGFAFKTLYIRQTKNKHKMATP
jgi:hypothetical protein